ncbi:MAG: twin-arginine translocase subunit TatC, partial [Propionicimonas sp.]|nr:twin-arginine translocase subunit TatC [Propionicimonas sp.]
MRRPRLNLGWLRPPRPTPGGVMSLADHLRELRYRLIVSLAAVVVAAGLAAVWYDQLYQLLMHPN